jgi:hypothetical protein
MEALTALKCWHCGSEEIVVDDGEYVCRRCGTVLGPVHQPARLTRLNPTTRRLLNRAMRMNGAGNTGNLQASISKTRSQRDSSETMANYIERLARALIETGYFTEDEARALAEAFVKQYRALRHGDGVRASLPKVGTVIEVLDSITSGRSNAEGGKYDMAIASALRSAFASTGVYKPLIRRALRLLRVEPSDDLVELGVGYFEELYEHLREEVGGVEPWRYATSIAIAAAALAKVEKLGAPPSFVKVELRIRGLENIYEELKLGKFINITEWNSENKETKL